LGRINVVIDDALEERLRRYIQRKYGTRTYGAIRKCIEEAIERFLDEEEVVLGEGGEGDDKKEI